MSIALIGATIGLPSFAHAQTAVPPPATTTTVPPVKSPTAAATPAPLAKADIIDINTATREQLMTLEGIGEAGADAIINGRPYKSKKELADKNIVPAKVYKTIKGQIVAKQTAGKSAAKTTAPAASHRLRSSSPAATTGPNVGEGQPSILGMKRVPGPALAQLPQLARVK